MKRQLKKKNTYTDIHLQDLFLSRFLEYGQYKLVFSIAVQRVLFDFGLKKLFNIGLRFHPCTETSIYYLTRILKITGYKE